MDTLTPMNLAVKKHFFNYRAVPVRIKSNYYTICKIFLKILTQLTTNLGGRIIVQLLPAKKRSCDILNGMVM